MSWRDTLAALPRTLLIGAVLTLFATLGLSWFFNRTRAGLTLTAVAEEPTTAAKLLSAVAQRLSQRLRENDTKLQLYGQLVLSMQQEIEKLIPER